ncbi:alpha-galactosidase [Lacticaseibacillus rhamnosus]|nr:alpha-galactosidase [Lacticaseibacillus rhamnosus]
MAKSGPSRPRAGHHAQERAITPKAAYVLAYAHNAFASPETCV